MIMRLMVLVMRLVNVDDNEVMVLVTRLVASTQVSSVLTDA